MGIDQVVKVTYCMLQLLVYNKMDTKENIDPLGPI